MTVPNVSVQTRPRARSYTGIPDELREHLEASGLRPSWQREGELAMLYSEGIEAVNFNDLPEEIQKVLARIRMPHNSDGHFVRGAVVLCTQTLEAYDSAQAEYQAIAAANQQRRDVDELDREVREQLGLGGVINPPGILHPPGHSYRPGDFVAHERVPTDDKK